MKIRLLNFLLFLLASSLAVDATSSCEDNHTLFAERAVFYGEDPPELGCYDAVGDDEDWCSHPTLGAEVSGICCQTCSLLEECEDNQYALEAIKERAEAENETTPFPLECNILAIMGMCENAEAPGIARVCCATCSDENNTMCENHDDILAVLLDGEDVPFITCEEAKQWGLCTDDGEAGEFYQRLCCESCSDAPSCDDHPAVNNITGYDCDFLDNIGNCGSQGMDIMCAKTCGYCGDGCKDNHTLFAERAILYGKEFPPLGCFSAVYDGYNWCSDPTLGAEISSICCETCRNAEKCMDNEDVLQAMDESMPENQTAPFPIDCEVVAILGGCEDSFVGQVCCESCSEPKCGDHDEYIPMVFSDSVTPITDCEQVVAWNLCHTSDIWESLCCESCSAAPTCLDHPDATTILYDATNGSITNGCQFYVDYGLCEDSPGLENICANSCDLCENDNDSEVMTKLTSPVYAGYTTLFVESTAGFYVGDDVKISGGGNYEMAKIGSVGSLVLTEPLKFDYPVGTEVYRIEDMGAGPEECQEMVFDLGESGEPPALCVADEWGCNTGCYVEVMEMMNSMRGVCKPGMDFMTPDGDMLYGAELPGQLMMRVLHNVPEQCAHSLVSNYLYASMQVDCDMALKLLEFTASEGQCSAYATGCSDICGDIIEAVYMNCDEDHHVHLHHHEEYEEAPTTTMNYFDTTADVSEDLASATTTMDYFDTTTDEARRLVIDTTTGADDAPTTTMNYFDTTADVSECADSPTATADIFAGSNGLLTNGCSDVRTWGECEEDYAHAICKETCGHCDEDHIKIPVEDYLDIITSMIHPECMEKYENYTCEFREGCKEVCVCLASWTTDDASECQNEQFGCQDPACDGDASPWCVVANPGCLSEEDDYGGGWTYCDASTPVQQGDYPEQCDGDYHTEVVEYLTVVYGMNSTTAELGCAVAAVWCDSGDESISAGCCETCGKVDKCEDQDDAVMQMTGEPVGCAAIAASGYCSDPDDVYGHVKTLCCASCNDKLECADSPTATAAILDGSNGSLTNGCWDVRIWGYCEEDYAHEICKATCGHCDEDPASPLANCSEAVATLYDAEPPSCVVVDTTEGPECNRACFSEFMSKLEPISSTCEDGDYFMADPGATGMTEFHESSFNAMLLSTLPDQCQVELVWTMDDIGELECEQAAMLLAIHTGDESEEGSTMGMCKDGNHDAGAGCPMLCQSYVHFAYKACNASTEIVMQQGQTLPVVTRADEFLPDFLSKMSTQCQEEAASAGCDYGSGCEDSEEECEDHPNAAAMIETFSTNLGVAITTGCDGIKNSMFGNLCNNPPEAKEAALQYCAKTCGFCQEETDVPTPAIAPPPTSAPTEQPTAAAPTPAPTAITATGTSITTVTGTSITTVTGTTITTSATTTSSTSVTPIRAKTVGGSTSVAVQDAASYAADENVRAGWTNYYSNVSQTPASMVNLDITTSGGRRLLGARRTLSTDNLVLISYEINILNGDENLDADVISSNIQSAQADTVQLAEAVEQALLEAGVDQAIAATTVDSVSPPVVIEITMTATTTTVTSETSVTATVTSVTSETSVTGTVTSETSVTETNTTTTFEAAMALASADTGKAESESSSGSGAIIAIVVVVAVVVLVGLVAGYRHMSKSGGQRSNNQQGPASV